MMELFFFSFLLGMSLCWKNPAAGRLVALPSGKPRFFFPFQTVLCLLHPVKVGKSFENWRGAFLLVRKSEWLSNFFRKYHNLINVYTSMQPAADHEFIQTRN